MIHARPEAPLSVARLAKAAGMSHTAFSVRELLGEPPVRYATRCRMDRAAGLLRAGRASIAQIAERVGDASEVGFQWAFKRHVGTSPAA